VTGFGVLWEVTDMHGVTIGEIGGQGGSVVWDGRATVQRVARGVRFDLDGWSAVNPLTDLLSPMFVAGNGTRSRLGLFAVASDPVRVVSGALRANPEPYLVDQGLFLDEPSPVNLSGRVGEQLSDTMVRVCDAAGVTRRRIGAAGDLIGEPIAYPAGTSFRQALAGLCDLAGFLPPHFDRDGVLLLRSGDEGDRDFDVAYDGRNILAESRTVDTDLLSAPNTFIVLGGGATSGPVVAVASVDPSAPNSVSNRGGRVVSEVVRQQGLDTVDQAERLARMLAETAVAQSETVRFGAVPDPAHDCYSLVSVDGVVFREWGWQMGLEAGDVMSHQVVSFTGVSGER
jgi:hypothetical protein